MIAPKFVNLSELCARLGCTLKSISQRIQTPGSPGRTAAGAFDLEAWRAFNAITGRKSRYYHQPVEFDPAPVLARVRELRTIALEHLGGPR